MRLTIQHETRYHYKNAPTSVIELLRLTPCNSDNQSVRDWRIDVTADVPLQRFNDAFGNITHTFSAAGAAEGLVITATGTVDTSGASGVVTGTRERLPVDVFLRETELTQANAGLIALAHDAVDKSNGTALDVAHKLNGLVHDRIAFEPGATDTATSASEALRAERGVCQDLTHVLIAAARAYGLPARYVCGYQFEDGRARDTHAGHAWGEIHVDDLGWVGFDPTAGASSNETYVRVAVGLDYLSAAPVRGAVYGGGGENLSVTVTMDGGGRPHPLGQRQSQAQAGLQSQ
ncbi:MAG: transglutaminase family protein [Pseudomonadota bacterium]